MKKYQIVEITENFNHAGTKATADIAVIADRLGYSRFNICMNTTKDTKLAKIQRQIGYRKDWDHCLHSVEEGAVVLLQHPFHHPQLTREKTLQEMKEKTHVKYICLILMWKNCGPFGIMNITEESLSYDAYCRCVYCA